MPAPAASGPVRSCRVCRTRRPKAELTRWVRSEPAGALVEDPAQTAPGRGYYSCSADCAVRLSARLAAASRPRNPHQTKKPTK